MVDYMYYGIIIFMFGLVIGSFLNVCIFRIPKEQSIVMPPSHCMACGEKLRFFDLIPVFSYIFLRGKCRYCGEKVSFRYPAVELLTAIVFTSLFLRYGFTVEFIAALYLMSVLIAVFFIDYDHRIIPHGLTITGLVGGGILTTYSFIAHKGFFGNDSWWHHLLGLLPGSGILFLVAVLGLIIYKSDEVMGMGDVYIFAPIGIFLGFKLCILDLMISIILAGVTSIILIMIKVKSRKDTVPFGPFIVAGTFLVLMWGDRFLNWYLNFFNV